jgi:hypothetical protein
MHRDQQTDVDKTNGLRLPEQTDRNQEGKERKDNYGESSDHVRRARRLDFGNFWPGRFFAYYFCIAL